MTSQIQGVSAVPGSFALVRNWSIALLLCTLGLIAAQHVLADVVASFELAAAPNPYLIAGSVWYFNLLVPILAVVSSIAFLVPGLILAHATLACRTPAQWVLAGLAFSLAAICIPAIIWHQATGQILRGGWFFALIAVVSVAALVLLFFRLRGGHAPARWSANQKGDLLAGAFTGFAVLALMSAKFYWENFSPDGAGAMNFVRLFINTDWPFWPPDSGAIQVAPGVTSFLFDLPGSWFQRAFGENELASRLTHILYIGMLHVVIVGLVRHGRDVTIRWFDHLLITGALCVYSLSSIYSGGYNPYFGDSPMPAARETLVMTLFLGYVLLVLDDRRAFAFVIGVLGYLALPTGGLWLLLTFLAFAALWRPWDYGRLGWMAALLVFCAALGFVAPKVITALGMPIPGGEFDARSIVNRLRYVTFWEPQRLAYLIVPLGIAPALSMFLWRRQDRVARMLTLMTAVFFLFFYFQGYRVLLHHFIPAMIPPLVVMWRLDLMQAPRTFWPSRAVVALALAASVFLAWPTTTSLHRFSREIGAQIEVKGDRFEGYKTAALGTFHDVFGQLFPIRYDDTGATQSYFGGPMVWLHYAVQPKAPGQPINYVLQPQGDEPPVGGTAKFTHDGYVLYVLDEALYQRHLATTFPTKFSAPLFHISRDEIFGKGARRGDRFVIDLVAIARGMLGIAPSG